MAILKKEKYFFETAEVLIIFVQLDTCRSRLRTGLAEMTHDVFMRSSPDRSHTLSYVRGLVSAKERVILLINILFIFRHYSV